jgi:hypothetical protein
MFVIVCHNRPIQNHEVFIGILVFLLIFTRKITEVKMIKIQFITYPLTVKL